MHRTNSINGENKLEKNITQKSKWNCGMEIIKTDISFKTCQLSVWADYHSYLLYLEGRKYVPDNEQANS